MQVSEAIEDATLPVPSHPASTTVEDRPPLHHAPLSTPPGRLPSSSSIRVTTTGNHSFLGGSPSRSVSFVGEAAPNNTMSSPKAVGAHSPYTQGSTVSGATDFGWDDDGQSSMSGYSAYSGGQASKDERSAPSDGAPRSFYLRLVRFYTKYNPEKLDRVVEFLAAYKGEEEQLFRILSTKYGPEPLDDENLPDREGDGRSDNGSMYHYAGARWELPKLVTGPQGGTDVETPYWPVNRTISDVDLLSLLRNLRTENEELSRCFMGVLAQHPPSCFNGIVYITKAPLPPTDDLFLGHQWAGRLANNKNMVHQNISFTRNVLHCTDGCQRGNASGGRMPSHERWRLTVYFGEGNPLSLYRVMWDPLLERDPPSNSDANSSGGELSRSQSSSSMRGEHPKRVRPIEQPVQPTPTPVAQDAAAKGVDVITPQAIAAIVDAKLQQFFAGFELSVVRRLNDLERRVSSIERKK